MNRFWNVIATLAVVIVLTYVAFCGVALAQGNADFEQFKQAVLPIVTAVLGYMAAAMPKEPAA